IAGPPEGSIRVDAARAQDCLAVEAVDIGYAPRRSGTAPSAVLPGRIHVSLQSPEVEKPRQALLPANAASREHASGNLRRDGQTAQTSYTSCWGKLSERDTHLTLNGNFAAAVPGIRNYVTRFSPRLAAT